MLRQPCSIVHSRAGVMDKLDIALNKMSTFTVGKPSHNKNGNIIPLSVLNLEGEEDEKAMLNRYRSDTTLDRIPGRSVTGKVATSPVLDSRINKRYQEVDDFIKVNRTSKWEEKCRNLESLIAVKDNNSKEGRNLESLIAVKDNNSKEGRNLESLIAVKDNNSKEGNKDLDDFIIVNCTFEPCDRSGYQDVEDLTEVNRISNQKGRSSDLDSFIEVKDKSNQRAIIGKELCTYCRKPLGTETKMILEALQICCHATCFKCEICKATLENLEAGDSIWIYKDTVHCSPCYSNVKATWTY
ncbi:hypothetical protein E2320_004827 [Naja naja]|nr:hypothetical protein E2320_004827 [Naja naja]